MPPVAGRSAFVSIVAWTAIALSVLSALAWCVQGLVAPLIHHDPEVQALLQSQPPAAREATAPFVDFLLWWAIVGVLVSLASLVCAIGLLRRRHWGRLGFVGVLAATMLGTLAMAWLQVRIVAAVGKDLGNVVGPMAYLPLVVFALVPLTLCAWIAKRLLSPSIAAEFS